MPCKELDWVAVGEAIEARRVALAMTSDDLADRAHVSLSTIKNLKRALRDKYSEVTLWRVAEALGWTSDSIDRIGRGEEPELLIPDPISIRRVVAGRPVIDVLDIDARLSRADAATLEAVKTAVMAILDLSERKR